MSKRWTIEGKKAPRSAVTHFFPSRTNFEHHEVPRSVVVGKIGEPRKSEWETRGVEDAAASKMVIINHTVSIRMGEDELTFPQSP